MKPALGLHERYLVVRSKDGWSVNLGSDTLNAYTTRKDAQEAAIAHVEAALADGRSADWLDVGADHPEGIA